MSRVVVNAGVCGFLTTIEVHAEGDEYVVVLDSKCPHVHAMAERLPKLDALREITYRGDGPVIMELTKECLPHPACPIPCAIIKAIEVEAGLALPADATIEVKRSAP